MAKPPPKPKRARTAKGAAKAKPAPRPRGSETELVRDGIRLLYRVGDYDAVDWVLFTVRTCASELELDARDVDGTHRLRFASEALEHARLQLRLSQGNVGADDREDPTKRMSANLPPALVSRRVLAELRTGKTTLRQHDGSKLVDRELRLAARRTINGTVDGRARTIDVLVAEGDGELIVVDDDRWPVVLKHGWDGECFVELRAAGTRVTVPAAETDEPVFSDWADRVAAAPAAPGLAASVAAAIDACTPNTSEDVTSWDPEPACTLIDQARRSLAGDAGLRELGRVVGARRVFHMLPYDLLRDCFAAAPSSGLPQAAAAVAAERGAAVPILAAGAVTDRRPHDSTHHVVSRSHHVVTVGTRKRRTVAAFWDAATGGATRVIDLGKPFPRGAGLRDDGTLVVGTSTEFLSVPVGATKPRRRPLPPDLGEISDYQVRWRFDPAVKLAVLTRTDSEPSPTDPDEYVSFGEAVIVDVERGTVVRRLRVDGSEDLGACFAGDGLVVVVGPLTASAFDVATGTRRWTTSWKDPARLDPVPSCDGATVYLTSTTDSQTRIHDAATGKLERTATGPVEPTEAPGRFLRRTSPWRDRTQYEVLDARDRVVARLAVGWKVWGSRQILIEGNREDDGESGDVIMYRMP